MRSEVLNEETKDGGLGTRWKGGYDYTAYALVKASEEDLLVDCIGSFV
jgi:hypothetical protein